MGTSMSELDAIRKRVEAATPGPWEWVTASSPHYKSLLLGNGPATWTPGIGWTGTRIVHEAFDGPTVQDAEFIAHARSDVPALLALLDETVELLRGLAGPMERMVQHPDEWPEIERTRAFLAAFENSENSP